MMPHRDRRGFPPDRGPCFTLVPPMLQTPRIQRERSFSGGDLLFLGLLSAAGFAVGLRGISHYGYIGGSARGKISRGAWETLLGGAEPTRSRSEEHTSELQSLRHLVCRLLLEKK